MTVDDRAPRVAIIGGGITGLAAAYELQNAGIELTLYEADDRLGGKIRTEEIAGVPIEWGADWFVTRNPAAVELCQEVGLGDDLVEPAVMGAAIWTRGVLHRVPANVRGVPLYPLQGRANGLLSTRGALRAEAERYAPRRLEGPDVSVGGFVRRRFGREVLERLVDPLVAASRSGDPNELSLAAAAPELDEAARADRSVIAGLRERSAGAPSRPPFLGIRGGMHRLIAALADKLTDVDVRLDTPVESLTRTPGIDRFRLGTKQDEHEVDGVICCLPTYGTARLVTDIDPQAATLLAEIRYEPAVVGVGVYDGSVTEVLPSQESGVLVPRVEGRTLTAYGWFSEKWSHARPDDGSTIVRSFATRARDPAAALEDAVIHDFADTLPMPLPPGRWKFHSWDAALPVYRVGHNQLVADLERQIAEHRGLWLAGAGLRGSGVPDCIAQGRAAARSALATLARPAR